MRFPENTHGVNPVLYVLLALPTGLGVTHHLDHVVRGNHVGWPVTASVNSFTYSLLIYPVIGAGLYLTVTDRAGAGYWAVTGALGGFMMYFFHLSPWAVEPPGDIILPYGNRLVGYLAFAALLALIGSLLVTTGYAIRRYRHVRRTDGVD
jgi:hypothetical protein